MGSALVLHAVGHGLIRVLLSKLTAGRIATVKMENFVPTSTTILVDQPDHDFSQAGDASHTPN